MFCRQLQKVLIICSELEVVLKLECTKDSTNLITCRLCDAGDVIKDYLQEANQLAIHADFNVKVLVCQTVMEFESKCIFLNDYENKLLTLLANH